MVFPNDSNHNRNRVSETNYTPWVIGGVVVVALIIGAYAMTRDRPTNTAEVKTDREITRTTPSVPAPSSPSPTSPNNPAR
jgi:hypothetical protein